jgi:hypothetical protein
MIFLGVSMRDSGLKFKGHMCFQTEWAGFDEVRPINVIIGRNNCGKSCLLDLIEFVAEGQDLKGSSVHYAYTSLLGEQELKQVFPENMSEGVLGGNHWQRHGSQLVGIPVYWERSSDKECEAFEGEIYDNMLSDRANEKREKLVRSRLAIRRHPLSGKTVKKISAERDIVIEVGEGATSLSPEGEGATTIIQRYINRSELPREVVQVKLLNALNQILGKDAAFVEIQVQIHDNDKWEVFLGEKQKGLIPLSDSGSGLKTIILCLLNLYAIPHIEGKSISEYVYLFEELENNLHPSLQRRLLKFIEQFAVSNRCLFFLTTHSSVTLDAYANSEHAQIVRVIHNGKEAHTATVGKYFDKLDVVRDLGAKASDLLQANGIVWVEGPSDRIYFNRWVELLSGGSLQEGRDYQCAFYGGSLLARYEALEPGEEAPESTNVLAVNSNAILLCDGDRTAESGKGSRIKKRASLLKAQMEKVSGSYVWVTEAKEIESYVPTEILREQWKRQTLKPIGQYEPFWHAPTKKNPAKGYFEEYSPAKTVDKVSLALETAPAMTVQNMDEMFEWGDEMRAIVAVIEEWNK